LPGAAIQGFPPQQNGNMPMVKRTTEVILALITIKSKILSK
jgi:hypothetical protein